MTLACPVACTWLMKSCRLSIRTFNSVSHKYRFLTCYSLVCWVRPSSTGQFSPQMATTIWGRPR